MITIVFSHPWHGSFNHAILETITHKLENEKLNYQIIDLSTDNFNPAMTSEELRLYNKGESNYPLTNKYLRMLQHTREIIFIFPIYSFNFNPTIWNWTSFFSIWNIYIFFQEWSLYCRSGWDIFFDFDIRVALGWYRYLPNWPWWNGKEIWLLYLPMGSKRWPLCNFGSQ